VPRLADLGCAVGTTGDGDGATAAAKGLKAAALVDGGDCGGAKGVAVVACGAAFGAAFGVGAYGAKGVAVVAYGVGFGVGAYGVGADGVGGGVEAVTDALAAQGGTGALCAGGVGVAGAKGTTGGVTTGCDGSW